METKEDRKTRARKFYEAHKAYWYDPSISIYAKGLVRLVELHRSDSKGWLLSVRYLSGLLGISQNTTRKAINEAIAHGLIEANQHIERKHRKLRLTASLRAPVVGDQEDKTFYLHHAVTQLASPDDAESESRNEPINNKVNIKANINESQINQKQIEESIPYKEKPLSGVIERIREQHSFLHKRKDSKL